MCVHKNCFYYCFRKFHCSSFENFISKISCFTCGYRFQFCVKKKHRQHQKQQLTSSAWHNCLHWASSEMKRWTSSRFPFSRGHSIGAVLIMGSVMAEWVVIEMMTKASDNRSIVKLKIKIGKVTICNRITRTIDCHKLPFYRYQNFFFVVVLSDY